MTEKISIIIPNFNSSKTIKDCLSAASKLNYKNYEVIVVDDASKDNSVELIKKFPCRLIRMKKNVGAAEARNIGARHAKGSILLFMDSDIIIPKDALKLAVDFFNSKKTGVFFASFKPEIRFRNFFSQYKHLYLCYYYLKQAETLHTIDTSFAFIRKKLFDGFNGFNSNIRISEDIDLGVRLTGKGHKIYRAKNIRMEHIKHYTFKEFIKTDLIRSERISKIFLSSLFGKRKGKRKSFYLRPLNIYISIPLASLALFSLVLALIFKSAAFIATTIILYVTFIAVNFNFLKYLAKMEGFFFAFRAIFINYLDMLIMNMGILITSVNFIINKGDI